MIGPPVHELRPPMTSFTPPNHFSPTQTQFEPTYYSPANTNSTTNEQMIFASTPENFIQFESHNGGESCSTNKTKVNLNSPIQTLSKRTPKDTLCSYCQGAFTSRGVKLHEQRCFRKRESDAEQLKQIAITELEAHATADREMYEAIIKQLSEKVESVNRQLQTTIEYLEISRHDHRLALDYADATAKSLSAARDEVAHLRKCLDSNNRNQKRSSELGTDHSRKVQKLTSRGSPNENVENSVEHQNRTPITDLSINRLRT
ncbi:hypothetical protein CROQUDRAFT_652345 [Cronartium quercuum f. sp. fusiforme G11]|uniref:Uncharacterized protein n=1 Tax=Cronartium quercuum f. sp. fusiforme G11 TaxID=708437 RepID=A0A9P6TFX9_9BASI|nr:hypothetical protein CROQUDRAFT_652345 [Cronartium quercuum f. sp. fusiforme G11]